MKKVKKLIVAIVMALAILVPAATVVNVNTITAAAANVKISNKRLTLEIGKSYTLKLRNTKKKVKWSSSNKAIAIVNKQGKVVAKAAGTTKITAKVGKKKYSCKVTVNFKNMTLNVGKKTTLKVVGVQSSKVKWSSSKKSVATVKGGKITAKKAGITTITAKVGKIKYSCKVKVKAKVNQPAWKSHFRIDYIIDTADGVLMKATNISSKTINSVTGYVNYKDASGFKFSESLDTVNGVAPKESFYMAFDHPYQKSYSSWIYDFKVNNTSLKYTSRKSSLSMVNPWFDINKLYWKSGVTVRNSSVRDLWFDIIAIYKYKGKIVGYGESVYKHLNAGSAGDYGVEGSSAADYDSVEHVINDCATYN